ncbi:MAG TPA: SulP family inorganic anion transporter, partial [Solirubrobacteraceae bacterium]|nr:SulP family inorganic anion transporter [Solirubrobacteraceae bacterium]
MPRLPGFAAGDLVAGVSVALVLIPQSLAYAELAGLPPVAGLYAGALPAIVAAFFASSPYLATGPVAIVSLLTFTSLSGLAEPGSEEYVGLALLLSLMVGAIWLAVGLLRAGVVAYLMSQPMLMGFIPAAALVIIGSQLPTALGTSPPDGTVISEAAWALVHIGSWGLEPVLLTIMVLVFMFGGKRIHTLFPGVVVAAVLGILFSHLTGYSGTTVGEIPVGAPPVSFDFPLGALPSLIVPAIVISLVGFAEAGSIARTFAALERRPWSSNREFVAQGMANLTAGMSGGYPVCGSFSRSAVNRLAGAQSRWAGAITGLVVLAFLPAAAVLES